MSKQPPQKDPQHIKTQKPLRGRKSGAQSRDEFEKGQKPKSKKSPKGASMAGGKQDGWRFLIMGGVMLCGFAALLLRAFWVQVVDAQFYIDKGNSFITSKQTFAANRGMITDSLGMPLAVNAPLATVTFNPREYAQAYYTQMEKMRRVNRDEERRKRAEAVLDEMSLTRLAAATGYPLELLQKATAINPNLDTKDDQAVANALPKGGGSQRIILLERTTPELASNIMALNFAGVHQETTVRRYYLQAEPNAQVLGYMGSNETDGYQGRAGIELKYEKELAGQTGESLMVRNAKRQPIEEVKEIKPEIDGQDIALTIDSRLQYVLYKELEKVGQEQRALWSSGMIVDVNTGDVLAMGSWPSFNSNKLSDRTGVNERNRPLLDAFEPGSVIKPFTVAAALESGRFNTHTLIDTSPGFINVQGSLMKDGGNYGAITMGRLIQKSSNVASVKIALSLKHDEIVNMQKRFGFGQKTALNFPAEAKGRVPTPRQNELVSRATLSYGYGQQVTLAQIAQAYATLGARGKFHPLRLVKSDPVNEPTQIISEKHAKDIVSMMELVVKEGGTARMAAIDGYRVAGKTGTSRRVNPKGGYYKDQHRAIFAGVAPASNPRFAAVILVENPRKQSYAGPVAGPVFANVMQETLRLYNVPFDKALEQ